MAKRVAIDTVPLPDKMLGMKVQEGTLTQVRNRYFLKVGRKTTELEPGALMPKTALAKLVGETVYAAYSNRGAIVAIGTWPTPERLRRPPRWILCNVPVPDLIKVVSPALRRSLVASLQEKGLISKELAKTVEESLRAGY